MVCRAEPFSEDAEEVGDWHARGYGGGGGGGDLEEGVRGAGAVWHGAALAPIQLPQLPVHHHQRNEVQAHHLVQGGRLGGALVGRRLCQGPGPSSRNLAP